MIPRQNIAACVTACRRVDSGRFRKNDMVIGIIGNTHGVKMARKPKPNAASRKIPRSSVLAGAAVPVWAAAAPAGLASL